MPNYTDASIYQINNRAKAILEREMLLDIFKVSGFVRGNPTISNSGNIYFTLVDGNYAIRCFLQAGHVSDLGFTIERDMEIEVSGPLELYAPDGRLSIEVEEASPIQRSLFDVNNSPTVKRLQEEGLHPRQKKKIPKKIEQIGLVTSKQSDALHDFKNFYEEHASAPAAKLNLVEVHVQGKSAPKEIADAINRLNQEAVVDVIVLTRGGGKQQDLDVFNDYLIAKAICQSKIPVVTGIGHQRNETVADHVADRHTRTPTDAAYVLATGKSEIEAPAAGGAVGEKWLPYVLAAIVIIGVILLIVFLAGG